MFRDINQYYRKSWRNISLFSINTILLFIPLNNISIAYSYTCCIFANSVNLNCALKPICLKDNQIYFLDSYQKQVSQEIQKADEELVRLSQLFSVPYEQKIGIVYFHEGQNNWTVRLIYGGIVLKIPDKTIYSTEEIYLLKKVFEKTPQVTLNGKSYPTTRLVKQLGPILHDKI